MNLPPLAEVMAHEPPMRLLDEVIAHGAERTCCRLVVRDDTPFLEKGQVPAVVSLEYMAQCVAVHAGLRKHAAGQPPAAGYLIAARELVLEIDGFDVGDVLDVEVEKIWGEQRVGQFRCELRRGDDVLAHASVSVYQPGGA